MRALPCFALALLGCSAVPVGPPSPPPEQSFQGVKTVALVHRVAWSGGAPGPGAFRRRDPLDALQEALEGRGVRTVTVELTEAPPPELAAVDALAREVEWGTGGAPREAGEPAVGTVGQRAAPVLAQLGADALAVYARSLAWAPPPPLFGPTFRTAPPSAASSLAVVARDGTIVTFAWGGAADPLGAAGPINAAEAVDAALALLAPLPAD